MNFYKTLLIGGLICMAWVTRAHNLKMAYFDISQSTSGDYLLKVSFDRSDIMDVLHKEFKHLKHGYDVPEMNDCVIEYLYQNLKLKFNQQTTGWVFIDFKATQEYFQYTFYLKTKAPRIRQIQIQNNCLVRDLDEHHNLIRIKLNGRDRMFKLNRRRNKTLINY